MSDEVECGLCGRNGGVSELCEQGCKGDPRHNQPRQYTLSEERSGRAPTKPRYGEHGEIGPKTSDPLWTIGG